MILTNPVAGNETPHFDIETLFRRHGALRVIAVAFITLITGRHRRVPDAEALTNHLRRDIGLEARHERRSPMELMR